MAHTDSNRSMQEPKELPNVIAFHAGTDWSSQLHLDLNSHLVAHPSATFFLRVKGNSPDHGAIRDGDLLIIDRALKPNGNNMIIAVIDGALVITSYGLLARRWKQKDSGDQRDNPVKTAEPPVWGVITYAIHKI